MAGVAHECQHHGPESAGYRWCCSGLAQIIVEALEQDLAVAETEAMRTGTVADHFRVEHARRAIARTVQVANRCGARVESAAL